MLKQLAAGLAIIGTAWAAGTAPAQAGGEVNVYSYRQPFLIQPIFDSFTTETGIDVNVVFAKDGLVERLKAEGASSPADLIFTVDINRLEDVVETQLVQPVQSEILETRVPARYRHPENLWFALTTRARVLYVSKDRVKDGEISTYRDLADPAFKGRICTRSGDNVYQVALLASMIAHDGDAAARDWLAKLRDNLARPPTGNDRSQAKAIMEGICDVSIGNTYYMGKMLNDPKQSAWAKATKIVFPNQDGHGTHMNISGIALTKAAPNKDNAIMLMEFLVGDVAQRMYADQSFEYPIVEGVPWAPLVQSWGTFNADTISLDTIANHRDEALKMVNEMNYNGGPQF